ncbi:MAG: bifunctional adenosylcobinamide kinase/adenosylcobinamide-phosphate guanylyltransferase [Pseudomonadota bacterium]
MSDAYFILGGARSGKSRRALALAEEIGPNRLFLATAEASDEEMASRIARHQEERGDGWSTMETPLDLVPALAGIDPAFDVCLVDCLTVWLSNLMHYEREVASATRDLCVQLAKMPIPIVLVSNEIGLGLVPETPLGRRFRDAQGRLNQEVARHCHRVEFIAAGLPLRLKG